MIQIGIHIEMNVILIRNLVTKCIGDIDDAFFFFFYLLFQKIDLRRQKKKEIDHEKKVQLKPEELAQNSLFLIFFL